jgi:hypothetical protein
MAMPQRQIPDPKTVPQAATSADAYVNALAEHDWPIPKNYAPGVTYLYVPADEVRKHKERGWSSADGEHLFRHGGEAVEFILLKKGVPLPGVHRHQILPDVRVYVPGERAMVVSSELQINEDS